jgi:hypothetical protein
MKTLWERLSEENQLILLQNQITYPTLYGSIILELKNTYGWTNLTVDTANNLIEDLTKRRKDFIDDLYKIFDNE